MSAERPGERDVAAALAEIAERDVVARILARDGTVWSDDPREIADRLGWLDAPARATEEIDAHVALARAARDDGIESALVLGMGGSSLAPEVFARVFREPGGLPLAIADSTDPAFVLDLGARHDPAATLHVVSSKSGTTIETLSLFRWAWERVAAAVGEERAGSRFVAITDPGTPLEEEARARGFRAVVRAPRDVGGRYSALTPFGLVPAALAGVDLARLLDRARHAAASPDPRLGAQLGAHARAGRDKLTLLVDPEVAPFGAWIEQLVAESTGKAGRGILPVLEPAPGPPGVYGDDRWFVHLRAGGALDAAAAALEAAGRPLERIDLADPYDLGAAFWEWEMATAITGRLLGIHPFDQPDVEKAKVRASEALARFRETGRHDEAPAAVEDGGIGIHAAGPPDLVSALAAFLDGARPPTYVAVLAYLPPGPAVDAALERLRVVLRDAFGVASTVGYGPRYLHSTGQLHKGDGGNGRFLVVTADPAADVAIPGEGVGFAALERAQALGDLRALADTGRRVLRLHLRGDPAGGVEGVAAAAEAAGRGLSPG